MYELCLLKLLKSYFKNLKIRIIPTSLSSRLQMNFVFLTEHVTAAAAAALFTLPSASPVTPAH